MATILFIHQNFPGQFCHLAPALAADGHTVLALGMGPAPAKMPGVRYFRHAPVGGTARAPAALRDLSAKLLRGASAAASLQQMRDEGLRPDVICVHPGWGEGLFVRDVFPAARIIAYAEYYYGGTGSDSQFDPEFATLDSLAEAQRIRLRNTHLLHAIAEADAGLAPTEFQRARHPVWFRERTTVIHEGIDSRRFQPNPRACVRLARASVVLRPGDEVVTFVARHLEPYRGYHIFMRALPALQRLRPHARIVIVGGNGVSYGAEAPAGDSWKDIFRREVAPRLDMSRVHFVGRLPHAGLTELMQVSAVYTYLTYPFVLSWSLMEALSVGCLIVGSRTGPVEEVIKHGHNGLLTDFFDPDALAHTIAEAASRQGELADLRTAARQTILSRYELHNHCLPAQRRFLLDAA